MRKTMSTKMRIIMKVNTKIKMKTEINTPGVLALGRPMKACFKNWTPTTASCDDDLAQKSRKYTDGQTDEWTDGQTDERCAGIVCGQVAKLSLLLCAYLTQIFRLFCAAFCIICHVPIVFWRNLPCHAGTISAQSSGFPHTARDLTNFSVYMKYNETTGHYTIFQYSLQSDIFIRRNYIGNSVLTHSKIFECINIFPLCLNMSNR